MRANLPEIIKTCERLHEELEQVVPDFPVKYRNYLGQDLRRKSLAAALLSQQAMMAGEERVELLQQLRKCNAELQLLMQAARRMQCFRSGKQYEALAEVAYSAGRQTWALLQASIKHLHGQNAGAKRHPPPAASRDTEYPCHPTGVNA